MIKGLDHFTRHFAENSEDFVVIGGVAAHEIMVGTPAVKNLIREGKVSQLYSAIQTGQAVGMQTLDQSLLRHFQSGQISADTLRLFSKFHPKSQSDGQSRA